jgi:hypothetical protein
MQQQNLMHLAGKSPITVPRKINKEREKFPRKASISKKGGGRRVADTISNEKNFSTEMSLDFSFFSTATHVCCFINLILQTPERRYWTIIFLQIRPFLRGA